MGEHGTLAGVEQRALLQAENGFRHGVERAAALLQNRLAALQHVIERFVVARFLFGAERRAGDRASATVDGDDGMSRVHSGFPCWCSHGRTNSVMAAADFTEFFAWRATAAHSASMIAWMVESDVALKRLVACR